MIVAATGLWLASVASCPATRRFGSPPITALRGIEPLRNRVWIDRAGARWWNGRRVADDRILDRYLAMTAQLNPQPVTVLTFARAAPCGAIARVRALMERRLDCSRTDACAVGRVPARRD